MWRIGDKIGEYDVLAQLRAGGMATLFLARRRGAAGFSRYVAIKVVHPHLASDPAFVSMFVDEALLSARIQHPNVVHVEELGEAEGTYFLVMEFVDGVSLAQITTALAVRGRRAGPALATHVAMRIAEGLHAAHETRGEDGELLGVVHRDVSPQNVLVAWQGHVKLIDFGIAKARGRAQHTVEGSLKGKLRYMAPEQALGRAVDRRTDVYALGIVLWEMLAQRRLFDEVDEMRLIDKVRAPEIAPPSAFVDGIPPALDAAVMAALAPDPAQRPATAHDLRRRLADAVPDALAIDTSDVAALLHEVLGAERARDLASLPQDVASELATIVELGPATDPAAAVGPTETTTPRRARAVETLTLDLAAHAAIGTASVHTATLAPALAPAPKSAPTPPATTRVATTPPPPRLPSSRSLGPWIAVAVGGLALVVGIASIVAVATGASDEPPPADAAPIVAAPSLSPPIAVSPEPATFPPPRPIVFTDPPAITADAGAAPVIRRGPAKHPPTKRLWIRDLGR